MNKRRNSPSSGKQAMVVQSERTIKYAADNLFEERQAMLVWLFINVCLVVCTAVLMGWK